MESRNLIYTPIWVRIASFAVLGSGLATGIGVATFFIVKGGGDKPDYILAAVSLAQVCASALALALILFYSERDVSFRALQIRSNQFLRESVPASIGRAIRPDWNTTGILNLVSTAYQDNQLAATYIISDGNDQLTVRVFLNVKRLIVNYHIPTSIARDEATTRSIFHTTLKGAEYVGYDVTVLPNVEAVQNITRIRCQTNLEEDFLINSRAKLFWANDIGEMTRSVFKHYRRAIRSAN